MEKPKKNFYMDVPGWFQWNSHFLNLMITGTWVGMVFTMLIGWKNLEDCKNHMVWLTIFVAIFYTGSWIYYLITKK
jgi:hypothetical protein